MYKVKTIECGLNDIEEELEDVLNTIDRNNQSLIQILQSVIYYDVSYTKVLITVIYVDSEEED